MRGNGISVRELLEVCGQLAAVFEANSAVLVNTRDSNDFAVVARKLASRRLAVSKSLSPAATSMVRPHRLRMTGLLGSESPLFAAVAARDDSISFHPYNL